MDSRIGQAKWRERSFELTDFVGQLGFVVGRIDML